MNLDLEDLYEIATDKFRDEFYDLHGREPTYEEIDFSTKQPYFFTDILDNLVDSHVLLEKENDLWIRNLVDIKGWYSYVLGMWWEKIPNHFLEIILDKWCAIFQSSRKNKYMSM